MSVNRPLQTFVPRCSRWPARSVTLAFGAMLVGAMLTSSVTLTAVAQQPAPAAAPNAEARKLAQLLIKNALIAVNQGNLTGNYTVLRDLSSPGFRDRNSASDLGTIFAGLRKQKLDLSPVVLLDPVITQSKFDKEQNQLRLTGFFPSEPVQIKFDLIFQMANPGGWMIHGVSIGAEQAEARSRDDSDVGTQLESVAEPKPSKIRQAGANASDQSEAAPRPRTIPASSGQTPTRPKR